MSNKPGIAKLVDGLSELYDLRQVTSVIALGEPESNRCWKFVTANGSFVGRRYRSATSNQVQLTTGFLRWCQDRRFQLVPELVPGKNGDQYFQLDCHWWWVARFVEGESARDWPAVASTPSHCFQAGRALRLLHEQTKLYQESSAPECAIKPVSDDLRARFDACVKGSEYKRLRQSLFQCLVVADSDPDSPILAHGDFHPGNIVFRNDELVAVLDFEYMHFEKPVFDVAYGGLMFSSIGHRSKLDFKLLREFVRGYDQPSLFPYLIPNMVNCACLCAVWEAEQNQGSDDFKHFINAAQYLSTLLQEDCGKILELAPDKPKS